MPFLGLASNVTVSCTPLGTHDLVTRNGNVMPMIMFYSSQTSHIIMSPNYAVSTSYCFSAWTQHSEMNSGKGHVQFSSPTGLHSECIEFKIHNSLWFLGTPRCNMKNMASSTAKTMNSLILDLQFKLWHHPLGHPGQRTLRIASDACDGIKNLQRHPLFKCGDYIAEKFLKCKKGIT